jgi:tetratricopeptide (TPR) repeat protein
MVIVLYCVGLFYRRQGVLQKAIPMLERGLALSQSADIPLTFPMTASLLSAAYALAGRTAEALPLLDQMLERLATGRRMLQHALVITELSEACLLVGRVDEASALAERLLDLSNTHTGHGYQAHACRLLGEVARRREPPDIDQATTHYRQALTLAEEVGSAPAAGALPSGSRHPLRHGRPGGADPCRAVDSDRDVSGYGDDLLAA